MIFWLLVLMLVLGLPLGILALTHPDGLAAALSLLTSRRGLFFFCLLMTGVVSGLFVGTELGQLKVQEGLNAEEFTFLKRRFELALGQVMPPLLILATLSPLPLLIALRRGPTPVLALVAVGFALWVGATVITLLYNVPINAEAVTWDPAHPPSNWEELRATWHRGQTLRTALTIPAFACLLLAALADER